MDSAPSPNTLPSTREWVPETAFGKWFLTTETWRRWVLSLAIADLRRLAGDAAEGPERMLDIGCGNGVSFPLLLKHFRPQRLIGIDIDPAEVAKAQHAAAACNGAVSAQVGSVARLGLADSSMDLVLCHQLLHHVAYQEAALQELYRVLKPGGRLLSSESCIAFINSWSIRLLFRHPPGVQKTSEQYIEMIRAAGFEVDLQQTEGSTPWWSLPDYGILRRLGWQRRKPDITEILIVARKPIASGCE